MGVRQAVVGLLAVTMLMAHGQTTVEQWQKKAVADYPELGVSGSSLNATFVRKVEAIKRTNPGFFRDPKWPYLVAEEISKTPIIPGLDQLNLPAATARPTAPAQTAPAVMVRGAGRVPLVAANDLTTTNSNFVGQMVCIQGVITRAFAPTLAARDKFYVQLQPNIICEFPTAAFLDRNSEGLGPAVANLGEARVDFEHGRVLVYPQKKRYSSQPITGNIAPIEVLKVGQKVNVYGRCDGLGSVGLEKGFLIRECSVVGHER
jgi:hypothetical protein